MAAHASTGEGATEEGGEPAELDDTENLLAKGLGSKEPSGLESSLQAAEANGVPECADHPVDAVPNGSKSGDVADSANTEEGTAKAGCDADQVIQARDNAERTEGASLEAGDTGNGGSGCLAVATPRETLEPRGSRTSLSPESEPFVPSQGSSQQVTPRWVLPLLRLAPGVVSMDKRRWDVTPLLRLAPGVVSMDKRRWDV